MIGICAGLCQLHQPGGRFLQLVHLADPQLSCEPVGCMQARGTVDSAGGHVLGSKHKACLLPVVVLHSQIVLVGVLKCVLGPAVDIQISVDTVVQLLGAQGCAAALCNQQPVLHGGSSSKCPAARALHIGEDGAG